MWHISEFALVFWAALACVTAQIHSLPDFFPLPHVVKSQETVYKFDVRSQASYKEHKEKVRWSEALARCQAEGAQLAVPHTRREAQLLLELFSGDTVEVWLALHDQFEEGHFVAYHDGKKASEIYTNWGPNEPNNAGKLHNEDCVTMNRHGKYVDIGCDEWQHRFICKKVVSCQSPSPSTRGYKFDRKTNTYYKEHKDYATWSQALASCQAQGAQLAVPHTHEEAEALLEQFSTRTVEVWLALHDQFKEGDFITYDEGKHDSEIYTNWKIGEPNNAGVLHNEDCVTMNRHGLYVDIGCDEWKHRYICKIVKHPECPNKHGIHALFDDDGDDDDDETDDNYEYPAVVPFNVPVPSDDGYKYDKSTNALYKEHKDYVSWSEALFKCKEENAQLAVPHTLKEAQALREYFSHDTVEVWIGLHDQFSEGHFVTTDGTPESQIYTNWSAGEPNNAGRNHNEDCVTINRKGLYVDIGCDEWKHRYICVKHV